MTGKALDGARGSPLRQRMIEQLRIANLAETTQSAYLFEIERLARHYGISPAEFIRRFLLYVLPERLHRIRHFGILANWLPRQDAGKRPRSARHRRMHPRRSRHRR